MGHGAGGDGSEDAEVLDRAGQLETAVGYRVAGELALVPGDGLELPRAVDRYGDVDLPRWTPHESRAEFLVQLASHRLRGDPRDDGEVGLLGGGNGCLRRSTVVGMAGDATLVEDQQQVRVHVGGGVAGVAREIFQRRARQCAVGVREQGSVPDAEAVGCRLEFSHSPAGEVVFADSENSRIRRLDAGGNISTLAGTFGLLGDGGPCALAKLGVPISVLLGPGSCLISDGALSRVRRIDWETALMESSWPMTRLCSSSSMRRSLAVSSSVSL